MEINLKNSLALTPLKRGLFHGGEVAVNVGVVVRWLHLDRTVHLPKINHREFMTFYYIFVKTV